MKLLLEPTRYTRPLICHEFLNPRKKKVNSISEAIAELESLKLDKTLEVIFCHSTDYKNQASLFFVV